MKITPHTTEPQPVSIQKRPVQLERRRPWTGSHQLRTYSYLRLHRRHILTALFIQPRLLIRAFVKTRQPTGSFLLLLSRTQQVRGASRSTPSRSIRVELDTSASCIGSRERRRLGRGPPKCTDVECTSRDCQHDEHGGRSEDRRSDRRI
jgi:hypothetical protein